MVIKVVTKVYNLSGYNKATTPQTITLMKTIRLLKALTQLQLKNLSMQ